MSAESVLDLLDHAVEPDPWECDGDWEYRAMHWRPSAATGTAAGEAPERDSGDLSSGA